MKEALEQAKNIEQMKNITAELGYRRDDNRVKPEQKLGWYYRNWKELGLDREKTGMHSLQDWDEQIA